jgi:MFS family permease
MRGEPGSQAPSRDAAHIVLLLTSVAAFMGYLDVTIVNVSFPSIQADFLGQPTNSVIWVLDIYSVVLAGLLLVMGRVSDVIGHRFMFLMGVGVFSVASAVSAAAPSLPILIAARGFQALGAAIFTPSSLALILKLHSRRQRPAAVATWTASAALAAAVGPALGGLLTGGGGTWRWIFIVNVPVGLIVVALGRMKIPRLPSYGSAPDALTGFLLLSAAFLAALAITRGRVWGWGSFTTAMIGGTSLVALVLFLVRNRYSKRPILDGAFVERMVLVSNGATFLVSLAFFAYLLTGVLFMTHVWHYSVLKSGLAMSSAPICAIPAALIASRFDRRHVRLIIVFGSLLIGFFGLAALSRLGAQPNLLLWLLLGAILGTGIGATLPLLSALAVEGVGDSRFATASALNSTVRQFAAVLAFASVAAVLGNGILGLLFTTYREIWLGIGLAGAFASGVILLMPGGLIAADRYAPHSFVSPVDGVSVEPGLHGAAELAD